MSYNLTLHCGCVVYVACHPDTGTAHTRVIEKRGTTCYVRTHDVGARLFLWELLPPAASESPSAPPAGRPASFSFKRN